MELKTVKTHRAPVRYYEGGSGQPLVFLHGAGGDCARRCLPREARARASTSMRR